MTGTVSLAVAQASLSPQRLILLLTANLSLCWFCSLLLDPADGRVSFVAHPRHNTFFFQGLESLLKLMLEEWLGFVTKLTSLCLGLKKVKEIGVLESLLVYFVLEFCLRDKNKVC